MQLSRLLGEARIAALLLETDPEITSLTEDSRTAGPGALFVAVRGTYADGTGYAADAVRRGAVAVVAPASAGRPEDLAASVPWVQVDEPRRALAALASAFHGHPGRKLRLAAVTGSKGKTTTTFLLAAVNDAAGEPSALLSTVAYRAGDAEERAPLTTPSPPTVHAVLRRAVDAGMKGAVVEASSHALDQERLHGLRFEAGVFTNLFPDHLDYHDTVEDYFAAKRRLFVGEEACDRAVVGIDGRHGLRLAAERQAVTTFGSSAEADVRPLLVESTRHGVRVIAAVPGARQVVLDSPLIGRHNASNLLAAAAYAVARGFDLDAAREAARRVERVPGRMEPVERGQPFSCLVDYSHTGPALTAALEAAREWTSGRVLVVVGAGGNRDRGRRQGLGEAAARLAQLAFLTSDNPRDEDPAAIVAEVERAYRGAGGKDAAVIVDRREAIAAAIEAALPGDTVIVAGRGHEREQILAGGQRIPLDDREVVAEALAARGYGG